MKAGLIIALLGIIFAIGGAAVETALAAAYTISQFFGFAWGRIKKPQETPIFTLIWVLSLLIGIAVLATGVNPVNLAQYAVIFSLIAMPPTYLPILLVSSDKSYMGKHTNPSFLRVIGWIFFIIICILALSSIPLMIITNQGRI